mgnify:CR=1 FL=1
MSWDSAWGQAVPGGKLAIDLGIGASLSVAEADVTASRTGQLRQGEVDDWRFVRL